MIKQGLLQGGLAADNGAAAHFMDEKLVHCVSSRPEARVYNVFKLGDEIIEETLEPRFLGENE